MRQFNDGFRRIARLALIVFACCTGVAWAQNASEGGAGGANSIQSLSVGTTPNGRVVIKVGLKYAPAKPPIGFSTSAPPRIILDFPDTENGLGKSNQEFSNNELRSANIVQAGSRTRVVINLRQPLPYETQIDGNTLQIFLQRAANTNATAISATTAPVSNFAEAQPSTQEHGITNVQFHRGRNGEGRIEVDMSDSGVGIDVRQQGKNLVVNFDNASLPRNLQRKLDVTDFATPVLGVDTFAEGKNVRMVIEPNGAWQHTAWQVGNKFIVEVKTVVENPNRLTHGAPGIYTGEKLTLNFQNIAVREALYVIADFINSNNNAVPMNMLISDSVGGSITLRLKDVPWDQALDIILQSKGLDMRKNGNVIQIAPREEMATKEKAALTASQEISDMEPLITESFRLSYQRAPAVAALLVNTTQRILTKRGSAVVDERTNTVFIKDIPSTLEEVRKLVRQIDVPVRQVMIEARFVQATENFNRTLGGRLGFTSPTASVPSGYTSSTIAGNVNLPDSTTGLGGLSLSLVNAVTSKALTLELTASETDGTIRNIASPRVMTANSTEAIIKQGTQIPYTTQQGIAAAAATSFKDAMLSLKVTPQITPDNHISMKLNVTQDQVGQIFNGVPSIDSKQITTQVLVENGGTVVIGGVYTLAQTSTLQKVPLLGDIPLLGWLFKNDNTVDNKVELLIFITPRILDDNSVSQL